MIIQISCGGTTARALNAAGVMFDQTGERRRESATRSQTSGDGWGAQQRFKVTRGYNAVPLAGTGTAAIGFVEAMQRVFQCIFEFSGAGLGLVLRDILPSQRRPIAIGRCHFYNAVRYGGSA